MTSQVQLALSRDLARRVVGELKLGERSEFDPLLRGFSVLAHALRILGIGRDRLQTTEEERVLESYYDRLAVFQVEKSRVIAVEFQSADPELAAKAANTVAEDYLSLYRAAKQADTRAAGHWLAGEIEDLRRKVADAEARVEEFRAKSNLLIGTNNTTLSNQQLAEVNSQLAAARSRKAESEAKAQFIRDTLKSGKSLEFTDFFNSELIRRLSEQRLTLRGQLAEQSSTLLDEHPRIKELKAQIADLDHAARGEAERLARSLENDARIAGARVDTLSNNLDQLKHQAASTNGQDVQLRALEREAKAQRDLLESYLAKYRETTARDSLGATPPEARIISRAVVSNTPYFPKKLPIVLIASLSMLFIAAFLITTRELMIASPYRHARPAAPMRADPSPAVADPLPPVDFPRGAPEAEQDAGSSRQDLPGGVADAERSIAEIAADLRGRGAKRSFVTGVDGNIDTVLAEIALARALAQDARVVMVDLALAAPRLGAFAIDSAGPGIAELVGGSASFGQIITRERNSRVHIVPAGRVTGETSAILASERLRMGIDALAQAYDYVLIAAGPIGGLDIKRIAELAPQAILVASNRSEATVAAARQQLAAGGAKDVTLLTGSNFGQAGFRPAAA